MVRRNLRTKPLYGPTLPSPYYDNIRKRTLQDKGFEKAGREVVCRKAFLGRLQPRRAPREGVPRELGHLQREQHAPDGPLLEPPGLRDVVQLCCGEEGNIRPGAGGVMFVV